MTKPWIIKSALTADEVARFLDIARERAGAFVVNEVGPHRKFLRLGDDEALSVKTTLVGRTDFADWIIDPIYGDYIGCISEGGFIHSHTDKELPGRRHVRINVLLVKPMAGGEPVIDGIIIRGLEVGDAWVCFSSKSIHRTTPVEGSDPRVVLSLGMQVAEYQVDRPGMDPKVVNHLRGSGQTAVLHSDAKHSSSAFGGIVHRDMTLAKAGDFHQGHRHALDHITMLHTGAVRVEREGEFPQEFSAPAYINIPANQWHKFTALKDNTQYACVFSIPAGMAAGEASSELPLSMEEILQRIGCNSCNGCVENSGA